MICMTALRSAGGFRQRLKRACARAGLPKRSPYALRHYIGTKQAGLGLNQAMLAQVMGHTTVATTMRYVAAASRPRSASGWWAIQDSSL